MLLTFQGLPKELETGLSKVASLLSFKMGAGGIPVRVERTDLNKIEVRFENGQGTIQYRDKVHFFRGLGLFLEAVAQKRNFPIEEQPQFDTIGAMFDCSRNRVLTPETVKTFITYMAIMGLNMIMLYTEDTYTIESEPYFGYMRGRYTETELREIDQYAQRLGVEVIPCIQTLAHLSSYLRWAHTADIQDTNDVLLVRNQKSYQFIEKMIRAATRPFQSNRIHIGMDEAHGLGRGKFLDQFGKVDRFTLMTEHLQNVTEITNTLALRPMVWSDMYFRVWSETNAYYDADITIPKEVVQDVPKEVQLVYWDYYNEDENFYTEFIRKHAAFGAKPVFAGGIWTWHGPTIHYEKTFNTTTTALRACKQEGVREVFATLWGDDGAESNYFTGLLGLQLFAEHGYAKTVDQETLKRRFEFCTGGTFDAFLTLGKLDTHPAADWNKLIPDSPTKFLLWQDPLLGLFDKQIEHKGFRTHYQTIEEELQPYLRDNVPWKSLYEFTATLCAVLTWKSELGQKLVHLYQQDKKDELKEVIEEDLIRVRNGVKQLRALHRSQWMQSAKPFGWEILDLRYGGLLARLETTQQRIQSYVNNELDRIGELEEDRLYYEPGLTTGVGKEITYTKIASPNVF